MTPSVTGLSMQTTWKQSSMHLHDPHPCHGCVSSMPLNYSTPGLSMKVRNLRQRKSNTQARTFPFETMCKDLFDHSHCDTLSASISLSSFQKRFGVVISYPCNTVHHAQVLVQPHPPKQVICQQNVGRIP
jgi:hypothetical protein